METQHTPGPWVYEEKGGIVYLPTRDKNGNRYGVVQTSGELRPVAGWMSDLYWQSKEKADEVRANARLIAAAPDMKKELVGNLSVLKKVVEFWEANKIAHTYQLELVKDCIRDTETAIAKAEGHK